MNDRVQEIIRTIEQQGAVDHDDLMLVVVAFNQQAAVIEKLGKIPIGAFREGWGDRGHNKHERDHKWGLYWRGSISKQAAEHAVGGD